MGYMIAVIRSDFCVQTSPRFISVNRENKLYLGKFTT